MEPGNRRLIRPSLTPPSVSAASSSDSKDHPRDSARDSRPPRKDASAIKKATPPDQTNAENFYYLKQMQSKTPMHIVLKDGEVLQGVIEWYDKCCLKVNRTDGEPNILLYKPAIKYMYKEA